MNTSIEVFIDGVAYSYAMERKLDTKNTDGIHFWRIGGLDKFIDVFYGQTNFLTRIGVHDKEYFDFDPRSIIFDLNNFREVLLEAHSLNKAHRAYFD